MQVILLTVFVGFVLVGFFLLLFVLSRREAEQTSAEHDSLMPLAEESVRLAGGKPDSHADNRP